MKKVLFATGNETKAKRFSKGLQEKGIEVITLKDINEDIEIEENGKESTYTWSKEDFYMVDKSLNIINPGYTLNTISINKKLNKYFTDITEEDKAMLQEDENDVVKFIANSINSK